jgi:hypothetical protein
MLNTTGRILKDLKLWKIGFMIKKKEECIVVSNFFSILRIGNF